MKFYKTSLLVASAIIVNSAEANITPEEVGQIALGVFTGALKTENLGDFIDCTVKDGSIVVNDIEDAVKSFEEKSISGVTKGLVDIADIFTTISAGIKECT